MVTLPVKILPRHRDYSPLSLVVRIYYSFLKQYFRFVVRSCIFLHLPIFKSHCIIFLNEHTYKFKRSVTILNKIHVFVTLSISDPL